MIRKDLVSFNSEHTVRTGEYMKAINIIGIINIPP